MRALHHRISLWISLWTYLSLVLLACNETLEVDALEFDRTDLFLIEDLQDFESTIDTGRKLRSGLAVSTYANQLSGESESSLLRSSQLVSFVLNDNRLRVNSDSTDYRFFGKSGARYDTIYKVKENHLWIYKKAPKDDLPSFELTMAEIGDDGQLLVPMLAIPIKKYRFLNNEEGHKVVRQEQWLDQSTHVRLLLSEMAIIDAADKRDLIPASFFDEKENWFYDKVLVDKPSGISKMIIDGKEQEVELGYPLKQGKIAFRKTPHSIIAYDLNIPADLPEQRYHQPIFEVPVEWVDYELSESQLKEVELVDGVVGSRPWHLRKYARVNFKDADQNRSHNNPSRNELELLDVQGDYLGFRVLESQSQATISYSFSKQKTVQEPRIYPGSDFQYFGFFTTERAKLSRDPSDNRYEARDQLRYLNRVFPRDGETSIKIYLTKDSAKHPEGDYVKAVKAAVQSWNEAFAYAGAGFNLEFGGAEDEDRVENGDVRYHKVAIYGEDRDSGLLGYGPSLQDTTTGETYSSTNHIYLRNYKLGLKRSIQRYVYWRLGAYRDLKVTAADDIINARQNEVSQNLVANVEANHSFTVDQADFRIEPLPIKRSSIQIPPVKAGMRRLSGERCDYMIDSMPITVKKIEKLCLEEHGRRSLFEQYIQSVNLQRSLGSSKFAGAFEIEQQMISEREALENCASKLIGDKLRATLVHEFGHNFGLRHNFSGSADGENFRIDPESGERQGSSSVMDYAHNDADRNVNLGSYDLAAVKYAYGQKIDMIHSDGSVFEVKLKNGESIHETVSSYPEARIKPYKFCSDEHIWSIGRFRTEIGQFDPMCRRWDDGGTPKEAVVDGIRRFQAYSLASRRRLDRESMTSLDGFSGRVSESYFGPLKQIYDYSRWLLVGKDSKASDRIKNLNGFEDFELAQWEENLSQESVEFKEYLDAGKLVVDFLLNLSMTTDAYCIMTDLSDKNAIPYVLPLADLVTDEQLSTSCDTMSQKWQDYSDYQSLLRDDYVSLQEAGEAQFEIRKIGDLHANRYLPDPDEKRQEVLTEIGFGPIRLAAIKTLFNAKNEFLYTDNSGALVQGAVGSTYELDGLQFYPAMSDDVRVRQSVLDYLIERSVNGLPIFYTNEQLGSFGLIEAGYRPLFQSEYRFLAELMMSLGNKLSQDEKKTLASVYQFKDREEFAGFKQRYTYNEQDFEAFKKEDGTYELYESNTRTGRIVRKYNQLLAAQKLGQYEFLLSEQQEQLSENPEQISQLKSVYIDYIVPNRQGIELLSLDEISIDHSQIKEFTRMARYYDRYRVDLEYQIQLVGALLEIGRG